MFSLQLTKQAIDGPIVIKQAGVKFWVGPPLENGFYYDVDLEGQTLTPADFERIEEKMLELARQNNTFIRKEISKADAVRYFGEKKDIYKLDLLERLEDGNITLYTQGNFTDLCRGPHIPQKGTPYITL